MASTRLLPWLLILPAAAVTLLLVAYPVGRGIWMSFTDADLKYFITGETSWVGLDQYRAIWNDPDLRRSFVNTLILGWSAVAGTMLVGCAAGLLLNIPFRGRGVLAVLVLLPWAVPSVAATSTFKYMFNDQYGVINWAGSSLGISSLDGYAWLTGRWSGLAAVAFVIVWQSFPFIALAVLAGLQSVSKDALEAASIDGAGAWSRLRYVVWLGPAAAAGGAADPVHDLGLQDLRPALRHDPGRAEPADGEHPDLHLHGGLRLAALRHGRRPVRRPLRGAHAHRGALHAPRRTGHEPMKASTSRKIAIYGAAAVLGLFALFPLYWMVLTSLKGEDELYTSTPDFFPNGWHGDRYWDVLVDRGIGKALLHSLYVATLSTIVAVAFATLAGYALARMYVPLKAVILLVLMAVQMLPVVVTLIPLFIQLRDWNLLDSLPGLALVYVAFNVPLAVWLMREYLRGIPVEIEEAAMIDGCSRMQAMARVILPLAVPGLAIAALLGFIASWSEFLFALTFITDGSKTTLPVAMVQTFTSRGGPDDTGMMVASVLYTVPVVIVFLIPRGHLSRGLVAGAVKG